MPIPMGPIASRRVKNDLLDIFELFDPGEVVLAKRRHGEVLVILTIHRTLAIGPDFAFSVLTGPEFPYSPAGVAHG